MRGVAVLRDDQDVAAREARAGIARIGDGALATQGYLAGAADDCRVLSAVRTRAGVCAGIDRSERVLAAARRVARVVARVDRGERRVLAIADGVARIVAGIDRGERRIVASVGRRRVERRGIGITGRRVATFSDERRRATGQEYPRDNDAQGQSMDRAHSSVIPIAYG